MATISIAFILALYSITNLIYNSWRHNKLGSIIPLWPEMLFRHHNQKTSKNILCKSVYMFWLQKISIKAVILWLPVCLQTNSTRFKISLSSINPSISLVQWNIQQQLFKFRLLSKVNLVNIFLLSIQTKKSQIIPWLFYK